MTPRRIDAHVHLWSIARGDYHWLSPNVDALHRDFGPDDLEPLLAESGIDAVVLVQAAATLAETRYLLDIAAGYPRVAGVVGWIDLTSAQIERELDRLCAEAALKGVRPMIQDQPDIEWMVHAVPESVYRAVASRDLAFDLLVRPEHLPKVHAVLTRVPDLRAIVDHCAKPDIARQSFEPWARDMARIASDTSALCKLSGLVTEAGVGWAADRLRPYVAHVLECFGAERVIWGSDWPVATLAASYSQWLGTAHELLSELSDADRARIFGTNAVAFYRL